MSDTRGHMAQEQTFIRVFGERNTGTQAITRMLTAQPGVLPDITQTTRADQLPQYRDILEQVEQHIPKPWQILYRDAVFDMSFAAASPTHMWKHSPLAPHPAFVAEKVHVVCCVRNPYSWAISMAQHPYHKRGPLPDTLVDFLKRPWMTLARDHMDPVLRSPLELWNHKNRSYLDFVQNPQGVPAALVTFEDFVADPPATVTRVLNGFSVPVGDVQPLPRSTKQDSRTAAEIAAYYAHEGWREWLTRDVVQHINDTIDHRLAADLGYTRLDPADFPEDLPPHMQEEMRLWRKRKQMRQAAAAT